MFRDDNISFSCKSIDCLHTIKVSDTMLMFRRAVYCSRCGTKHRIKDIQIELLRELIKQNTFLRHDIRHLYAQTKQLRDHLGIPEQSEKTID